MGFSHNARKLRDRVRRQYTKETGLSDWKAPEFQRWLVERGELDADAPTASCKIQASLLKTSRDVC